MKKLLVTGISGFLGECIVRLKQDEWELYGIYHNNPVLYPNIKTYKANVNNLKEIEILFNTIQPDALIHLAANANPNFCETNAETTYPINVKAPAQLATICKEHTTPFIFVSTDLVFDGNQAPYKEQDIPLPISVYGTQKVAAENAVLNRYPEACIVRCPVMFGLPDYANSFMKSWLKNLKDGKTVYAFKDEFRTVVSGTTAVRGMLLLLEKGVSGIWHLGGNERLSRYDFAIQMADEFGYSRDLIIPSIRADVKMPAARPTDVSLDNSKAINLGYQVERVKRQLQQLQNQHKQL